MDITRQCTASSDATMVSGHEDLTDCFQRVQRIRENCVPRTFGGIMMWNGSTRGTLDETTT